MLNSIENILCCYIAQHTQALQAYLPELRYNTKILMDGCMLKFDILKYGRLQTPQYIIRITLIDLGMDFMNFSCLPFCLHFTQCQTMNERTRKFQLFPHFISSKYIFLSSLFYLSFPHTLF